jgi:hypothetical protein
MTSVWRRPLLTATEIAYRWAWGLPLLAVIWFHGGSVILSDPSQVQIFLTVALHGGFVVGIGAATIVSCLALVAVWVAFSAIGRAFLLKSLDPTAKPRWVTLAVLAVIRVAAFFCFVLAWLAIFVMFALPHWLDPRPLSLQPTVVGAFALIVISTLLLFLAWVVIGWIPRVAAILSAQENLSVAAALRRALQNRPLRGKLIEINLVMGIVKVALLVLAMVFSACPLPFESYTTQTFLTWWWIGIAVWYLVMSDFFHVVRLAAYTALAQAENSPIA